jgi:hypothetical protein
VAAVLRLGDVRRMRNCGRPRSPASHHERIDKPVKIDQITISFNCVAVNNDVCSRKSTELRLDPRFTATEQVHEVRHLEALTETGGARDQLHLLGVKYGLCEGTPTDPCAFRFPHQVGEPPCRLAVGNGRRNEEEGARRAELPDQSERPGELGGVGRFTVLEHDQSPFAPTVREDQPDIVDRRPGSRCGGPSWQGIAQFRGCVHCGTDKWTDQWDQTDPCLEAAPQCSHGAVSARQPAGNLTPRRRRWIRSTCNCNSQPTVGPPRFADELACDCVGARGSLQKHSAPGVRRRCQLIAQKLKQGRGRIRLPDQSSVWTRSLCVQITVQSCDGGGR